jgi:hypothetical protein
MRWRRLLIAVLVLLLLAAGAVALLPRLFRSEAIRAALERQLEARFGQPVRIGSANAALFPRPGIELHDVSIGAPVSISVEAVSLGTGLRPLLSRTISGAEVIVDGGRVRLPLPFPLGGSRSARPDDGGGSRFTVASIDRIALRDLQLAGTGPALTVDMDASVSGDRLDIHRVSAHTRSTRIEGSGALSSIARLEGTFDAKADSLDLAELIALASSFKAGPDADPWPGSKTEPAPMHLVVRVTAPTGTFNTLALSDLSATVDIVSERVRLEPLSVRAFGGGFEGSLLTTLTPNVPELQLRGRVEGLDVEAVLKATGSAGGVTGRLGGAVALTASGTEIERLLRTARGSIAATIADGSMPHLDMVRTIVLAFGKPSGAPPAGSGSVFSRLGGHFSVTGGTLTSDDLAMISRDFDVAGRGSLDVSSGRLDARGDVVLSKELTAQAGTDLRRYAQEDGRVVIPATVGGTLQRPVISLDIAAAMRRALGNELRRRTKSLLDELFRKRE